MKVGRPNRLQRLLGAIGLWIIHVYLHLFGRTVRKADVPWLLGPMGPPGPTDDRPYFFNLLRLSRLGEIAAYRPPIAGVIIGNLVASLTLLTIVIVSSVLAAVVLLAFRLSHVTVETPSEPQALRPSEATSTVALVFPALSMPPVPEAFPSPASPSAPGLRRHGVPWRGAAGR